MSSRKRIATDLDETLFDMMTPFKQVLMKRHSARVVDPQTSYNIKTYPEISDEEIWDIFKYLYKAHILCEPYVGAKLYLERVYQITERPPIILTSRPEGYETETYTQVQSLVGDMPFHLIISGVPAEKKFYFADQFDIMVDDRLETLMELNDKYKKQCIVVNRPWNQTSLLEDETDQWWYNRNIVRVGGVREITPFLPIIL